MKRSGSTLQYQIVAHLVEAHGLGRRVEFAPPAELPALVAKYRATAEMTVTKTHACIPEVVREFEAGNAIGFCCYRDLRDVAVSLAYKNDITITDILAACVLEECVAEIEKWAGMPRMLVSRYEDMIADPATEVGRVAQHLGLTLPRGECEQVAAQYAPARQFERIDSLKRRLSERGLASGVDDVSMLHDNHLRAGHWGQWQTELPPHVIAEIEGRVGGWLADHGYPLATMGRPPSGRGGEFVLVTPAPGSAPLNASSSRRTPCSSSCPASCR
jgi:hypothetical protein